MMAPPTASTRARAALVGRLLAGHFACYPLMFGATVAAMSLSIIAQRDALVVLEGQLVAASDTQRWLIEHVNLAASEAAAFELVMTPLVYGVLLIFVVTHAAAIPWALAARHAALHPEQGTSAYERATRRFLFAAAASTGVFVIAGAVGWIVIFAS
jgi:hypothetical protein